MDILPSTVTSQLHQLCPDTPPDPQCRVIRRQLLRECRKQRLICLEANRQHLEPLGFPRGNPPCQVVLHPRFQARRLKVDIRPDTATSQLHPLCPVTPSNLPCRAIRHQVHLVRRELRPIPRIFLRKDKRERPCQVATIPISILIPIRPLILKARKLDTRCHLKATERLPQDSNLLQLPHNQENQEIRENRDKLPNPIADNMHPTRRSLDSPGNPRNPPNPHNRKKQENREIRTTRNKSSPLASPGTQPSQRKLT